MEFILVTLGRETYFNTEPLNLRECSEITLKFKKLLLECVSKEMLNDAIMKLIPSIFMTGARRVYTSKTNFISFLYL